MIRPNVIAVVYDAFEIDVSAQPWFCTTDREIRDAQAYIEDVAHGMPVVFWRRQPPQVTNVISDHASGLRVQAGVIHGGVRL